MRAVYRFLAYLLMPLVLLRLLWRSLRAPAYRQRWKERFGIFTPPGWRRPSLWIHAVSVGEVQAAAGLIKLLFQHYPESPVVVTTTTPTGSERVRQLFGDQVFHVYFPYDITRFLERFLTATGPAVAVIMETEIWPNLLRCCKEKGIPTVLANARLSARSATGYARVPGFTRDTLRQISVIAAQGEYDAQRFRRLGARPEDVHVTGSIKFDIHLPASLREQAQVLRRLWGVDRPVWVAASTHEGEEELLLEAQRQVREKVPNTLLVWVPRHPERFARVAGLVLRRGMRMVQRSEGQPCSAETQVFLGDSMGELPMFLAAADAAFVGGSMINHGGHNMLEPAALGIPVVFGPYVFNFADISRLLLSRGAARQVASTQELVEVLVGWLQDASERARIGENGLQVVAENRGALQRLFAIVRSQLEQRSGEV